MESIKQTAVEWLIEQLKKPYSDKYIMDIIDQAKTKEKEQLLSFAKLYDDDLSEGKIRSREDLYRETYGK
jgi:uncharacterized protein HemY